MSYTREITIQVEYGYINRLMLIYGGQIFTIGNRDRVSNTDFF